jgi:hypothetical protein
MAADIRIKTSFIGHRKRRKLRSLLGPDATDYLLDLWLRVSMERPNGVLTGMDDLDIALMAGWPGDPSFFCECLELAGLLDRDAARTLSLHDWAEHQPWVIGSEDRKATATKAAITRWEQERAKKAHNGGTVASILGPVGPGPAGPEMPEVGTKYAQTMPAACPPHAPLNAGSMPGACQAHANCNAPFLSSPLRTKNPPVLSNESTAPRGGATPYSNAFEAWWKLYPKKVAKTYAWKCWKKIKGVGADVLIEALRAQVQADHFRVGKENCVPDPSKWLNQGRWEDEVKAGAGGGQAMAKLKAMRGESGC